MFLLNLKFKIKGFKLIILRLDNQFFYFMEDDNL